MRPRPALPPPSSARHLLHERSRRYLAPQARRRRCRGAPGARRPEAAAEAALVGVVAADQQAIATSMLIFPTASPAVASTTRAGRRQRGGAAQEEQQPPATRAIQNQWPRRQRGRPYARRRWRGRSHVQDVAHRDVARPDSDRSRTRHKRTTHGRAGGSVYLCAVEVEHRCKCVLFVCERVDSDTVSPLGGGQAGSVGGDSPCDDRDGAAAARHTSRALVDPNCNSHLAAC